MKIKGFTLIELLAVIVILAIIALIAVPIILDLIGNTKVSAAKRSVENYIDAVELYLVRSELDQNKVTLERNNRYNVTNSTMIGEKTYPAINDLVEITGSKPTGTDDYVQLNEKGKVTDAKLTIGGYEVEIKDGKITSVKGGAIVSLESISLNITNQTMEKGSTFKLIPTFVPSNASNQEVIYESSDTNIVTVDNQGNVTAVNSGTTKVIVTSKEDASIKAECSITVVVTATGLTLTPTTAEIKTGETVQLEGTISPSNTTTNSLTWVSSNADIASVDSNGLVTGVSEGSVVITASTVNGIEATSTITVKPKYIQFSSGLKSNTSDVTTYSDGDIHEMYSFSHDATEQTEALIDYRYIGNDPYNYVIFNNETWRIIGIFTVEKENGTKEQRIKIIRDESIGDKNWDDNNNSKIWETSTLQIYLNGEYYTSLLESSKNMIVDTKYYIAIITLGTAQDLYASERGNKIKDSDSDTVIRSLNWTGKIGLMYASDYLYTYANGVDDLIYTGTGVSCDSNRNCVDNGRKVTNGWLYNGNQWLISPGPGLSVMTACIIDYSNDILGTLSSTINSRPMSIYPTLYLSSNVQINSGTGKQSDPYTLKIN